MALPTLDATFASAADLPRKYMLARWLVEELGEAGGNSNVLVSGAGSTFCDGLYVYDGVLNDKSSYRKNGDGLIFWESNSWYIYDNGEEPYQAIENVDYPWLVTSWDITNGLPPAPIFAEVQIQSSSIANYYDLPERYLWAKIAVAAGGPREEAAYISLPKNYAWSDIYNAVAGSTGNHTDWSENVALGHIAAAYRGDMGNPANLATYIDWPWRYQVASIITAL
jgi:hypothetical protein